MRHYILLAGILFTLAVLPVQAQTASPPGTISKASSHATVWGERLRQGGTTAWVQIGLSVFGAGFVFQQIFRLRQKYLVPEGLADRARALWTAGKFAELEAFGEAEPSTLARAISFIARNRSSPMVEVSEVCGELVSRELAGHYQRAYPLGIVATLAPLLGLPGMILGMIDTFETVALAGSLGDPTQLASGISEALVTTGLGLAIAIPFLALYHIFKHRTAGFGMKLEEEITGLLTAWLMKNNSAAMRIKKPEDEPFEIMLIPMIDCMLVIIIFFLVATTFKHRQEKQLPLTLPASAAALQIEQPPDLFIIGVDKDGHTYISTGDRVEQVNNEQLHARIRERARANPNQRVRIDGDRDARFEDIVHIVDLCQFEQLRNVGLHTKSDGGK